MANQRTEGGVLTLEQLRKEQYLTPTVTGGNVVGMKKTVQAIPGQKTWQDYGLPDLRKIDNKDRILAPPVYEQAATEESALEMVRSVIGIKKGGGPLFVKTPLETVQITDDNLFHFIEKRENARERYAEYIVPTLQNPYEIWGTAYDDGKTRNRYIGLFTGKTDIAVVVKMDDDGGIVWNMMNADRTRINKFRAGELLWHK